MYRLIGIRRTPPAIRKFRASVLKFGPLKMLLVSGGGGDRQKLDCFDFHRNNRAWDVMIQGGDNRSEVTDYRAR